MWQNLLCQSVSFWPIPLSEDSPEVSCYFGIAISIHTWGKLYHWPDQAVSRPSWRQWTYPKCTCLPSSSFPSAWKPICPPPALKMFLNWEFNTLFTHLEVVFRITTDLQFFESIRTDHSNMLFGRFTGGPCEVSDQFDISAHDDVVY